MQDKRPTLTSSIGLLILRVVVGGYLITHGWGKLQNVMDGNFDFVGDPVGLGNQLSAIGIVAAEVGCAALVVIGLATRIAALPVVFAMGVAAFVVHAEDPWTMGGGASKEPALLYLSVFLALVFTGAGKMSVDGLILSLRHREPAEGHKAEQ